jgi:hypothetical protein
VEDNASRPIGPLNVRQPMDLTYALATVDLLPYNYATPDDIRPQYVGESIVLVLIRFLTFTETANYCSIGDPE